MNAVPSCNNVVGISLKIAKWNELKWDSMTLCWPSGRDTVHIHLRKLRRKGGTLWAIGIASQRSPLTNTPRGKSQIVIIPLLVYVPLKNIYKFIQSLLGGIIKFYGGIFPPRYRQRAIYLLQNQNCFFITAQVVCGYFESAGTVAFLELKSTVLWTWTAPMKNTPFCVEIRPGFLLSYITCE